MNPAFSDEEKRFVLAETIKTSRLNVDALIYFIKSHGVQPNWMDMQLPNGRNMNQCMQAAELMTIVPPSQKRKASDDQSEHLNKRPAYSGQLEPSQIPTMAVASKTTAHKPLLPRPPELSSMVPQPQPQIPLPQPSIGPRKRGRPSRFDKSRKLHANLPQIAPRTTEANQPNPMSQSNRPAVMTQLSSSNPADPGAVGGTLPLEEPRLGVRKEQTLAEPGLIDIRNLDPALSHMATPRVLPEVPPQHQIDACRARKLSSPIPLEPDPRTTPQAIGSPSEQRMTLAPLLGREGEVPSISSSYAGSHAPLANSA